MKSGDDKGADDKNLYSADCLAYFTANPGEVIGTYGNGRVGDGVG